MMDLNYLYDLAEKENIKIYDYYIENANGVFINIDKLNAIALNYDNFETSIDEKCVLSEELGHYYMDATYPIFSEDIVSISKQEYRAKKWSYFILVPFEKLKSAILEGFTNLYSFADYFEVTVEYMKNAIDFYVEKYGFIY